MLRDINIKILNLVNDYAIDSYMWAFEALLTNTKSFKNQSITKIQKIENLSNNEKKAKNYLKKLNFTDKYIYKLRNELIIRISGSCEIIKDYKEIRSEIDFSKNDKIREEKLYEIINLFISITKNITVTNIDLIKIKISHYEKKFKYCLHDLMVIEKIQNDKIIQSIIE